MNAATIVLRHAEGAEDIAFVRRLFANYGAYLAANPTGAANICIQDYERELDSLPGPYAPPNGLLLLALVDESAVGCCALKPIHPIRPSPPGEAAIELKRLWVEPVARGLRLGQLLVEAAIAHAQSLGRTAIYLDTVPAAMPEANRLYEAFGFERIDRYNDNPVKDVVFFRKQLHPIRAEE
jgi:GNAT superfamily N-acetyltransferase